MDNNSGKKNDDNSKKQQNTKMAVYCLIAAGLTLLIISYFSKSLKSGTTTEVSYNSFLDMVAAGEVQEVEIDSDRLIITPKNQNSYMGYPRTYYTGIVDDPDLKQVLYDAGVTFSSKVVDRRSTILQVLVAYVLPFAAIYIIMFMVFRSISKSGGGVMGVGKSNAKIYVEKETGVTFKDVAGEEEAKESISELVDFLHNPGKYQKIGAKLPKGALLVGPPGTGKTLLAKAVAGEAHVPFFSLAGSDFVEMFVGVGASRVRDLFKQAQSMAPCIVFIDEIDAIGKSRDSQIGGGNDEREQTLNQLLAEMDGFDTSKGIVILAATNRPEVLDKALLRPGRFDRRIIVERPDLKGRVEILKVHAKNVLMDDSVDLEAIALATAGAVGSDLANIINEAAIRAVKEGRNLVNHSDLMESVEVVIAGKEKKDRILTEEEKKVVAYHETGHALIAALQKHSEPVQKITIVPRTSGTLGYVLQNPEEEKHLQTEDELRAMLVEFCGGRAAEEVVFGKITTGAANDIEKATGIARAMITQYGMSDKFGMVGFESIQNRYLDGCRVQNCGPETAAEIDREVVEVMRASYAEAKQILSENRDIMDRIANFLFEKETITGKEFMKFLNEVMAEREAAKNGDATENTEETGNEEASAETEDGTAEGAEA